MPFSFVQPLYNRYGIHRGFASALDTTARQICGLHRGVYHGSLRQSKAGKFIVCFRVMDRQFNRELATTIEKEVDARRQKFEATIHDIESGMREGHSIHAGGPFLFAQQQVLNHSNKRSERPQRLSHPMKRTIISSELSWRANGKSSAACTCFATRLSACA